MEEKKYLNRCIELAKKAEGYTYPNPLVGSVIVHQGKIIGEGYHRKAGEPHAEINAINSVKDKSLLPESTIYVSLEPCSHFGKTPPCALKLKEIGFKKVVIGAMDIHEKVNGKGKSILEDSGIEVVAGILDKECQELNKRFFTFHREKRPYIILKWAESSDGFLDKEYQPYAISNPYAKQWVHQLRAKEHAILVGTQTALNDNPTLTTREITGRNPIRILIDFDLKVPTNFHIFNEEAPTIVFNAKKEGAEEHIQYVKINRENALAEMMKKLYELQIQSVLVEGGSFTHQEFIQENLWDEAYIIKNPNLCLHSGTKAPVLLQPAKEEFWLKDNQVQFFTRISIFDEVKN